MHFRTIYRSSSVLYPNDGKKMRHSRSPFRERRHNKDMPRVPFKDSHGATITQCRRIIPDRRIGNIQAEWIDELMIS